NRRSSHAASRARVLRRRTAAVLGVQFCRSDRRLGPRGRRKTRRGRTALLALDAEFSCSTNCLGLGSGSLALNGKTSTRSCPSRTWGSRLIEEVFCAKGAAALFGRTRAWIVAHQFKQPRNR